MNDIGRDIKDKICMLVNDATKADGNDLLLMLYMMFEVFKVMVIRSVVKVNLEKENK